jgi:hypothetical protein
MAIRSLTTLHPSVLGLGLLLLQTPCADANTAGASLADLPIPAQGAISAALGRDDGRYAATPTVSGFATRNDRHGLRAAYDRGAVTIASDGAELGLRLRGLGRGARVHPLDPVLPRATANRVEYAHAGVSEWYANGPLGLQHGFTLEDRPAGASGERLVLALQLSGTLSPRLDDGDLVLLSVGGPLLRYRGLTAVDAGGRTLPARLALEGTHLRVEVDDHDARYPVLVDPFIQSAKLTSSDGASQDSFGFSVAVLRDTIVVGAKEDDIGTKIDQGSAYVFVRPLNGWTNATESAKLTASDGAAGDQFGVSVAIGGNDVFVGAWNDDNTGSGGPGSVYVFRRPPGGWAGTVNEIARLQASDRQAGDLFGAAIAASGRTLVVGAPFDDFNDASSAQGSGYVFVRPTKGWVNMNESAKLHASDQAPTDRLGSSVAVFGDTVVLGAPLVNVDGVNDRGAAYVFVEPGEWKGALEETAKLTADDGQLNDSFGFSVGIRDDTVVCGSILHMHDSVRSGAAYVFVRPATGWETTSTPNAELRASDGATVDRLGESIAVARGYVVAGARSASGPNHPDQGAAYLFLKPPTGWTSTTAFDLKLTAADGAGGDLFGTAVAQSGSAVVVGAWGDTFGTSILQGSAYVFVPAELAATKDDGGDRSRE